MKMEQIGVEEATINRQIDALKRQIRYEREYRKKFLQTSRAKEKEDLQQIAELEQKKSALTSCETE